MYIPLYLAFKNIDKCTYGLDLGQMRLEGIPAWRKGQQLAVAIEVFNKASYYALPQHENSWNLWKLGMSTIQICGNCCS